MVSQDELQQYQKFLDNFRINVVRCIDLRFKIIEYKLRAINEIKKYFAEYYPDSKKRNSAEGISLLERAIKKLKKCTKNERWFLKIVRSGLDNSLNQLKIINSWLKENVKDNKLKKSTEGLLSIVDIFYSRYGNIENRLKLEEKFVESHDPNSFEEFMHSWEYELQATKKLIKKIGDVEGLNDYFTKTKIFFEAVKKNWKIGAISSVATLAIMSPVIHLFYKNTDLNQKIAILVSILTSAYVSSTILLSLEQAEVKLWNINMEHFNKITAEIRQARRNII